MKVEGYKLKIQSGGDVVVSRDYFSRCGLADVAGVTPLFSLGDDAENLPWLYFQAKVIKHLVNLAGMNWAEAGEFAKTLDSSYEEMAETLPIDKWDEQIEADCMEWISDPKRHK